MNTKLDTKQQILTALEHWIAQRPGLEFANYGDLSNYRSELRRITQQRHDANALMLAVSNSGITADDLLAAFKSAYSGRLTCEIKDGKVRLEYCTGQYWPTEYRAAACAVLASALWRYHRDDYDNDPKPGDSIRAMFRREFGRSIQSRWFD